MKLPQLHLRDLFWLVLVAACLCWAFVERREYDELLSQSRAEIRVECPEEVSTL